MDETYGSQTDSQWGRISSMEHDDLIQLARRLVAGDLDMDGSAEIVVSEGALRTSTTAITVYGSDGIYRGEFNAFTDSKIYGALVTVGQTKVAR